jgi:nucleoside-diphosphate-sugar epimerase
MRVVVVGGSGHIGSFLLPRLVAAGHQVINLSRGHREPYVDSPALREVHQVTVDRAAEDEAGTFAATVAAERPDAVVDLICFTPESARALVDGLRGRTGHLLHCGSIWMHGPALTVPISESDERHPVGTYGVAKSAIAELLVAETASGGLVTTSLHPGHISGPGWAPITPLGNLDPGVWRGLAAGEELLVPGLGTELLSHVHADDVAQAFELALARPEAAAGQVFHTTAPRAATVRGLLDAAAGWWGREPVTRSVGWAEYRDATTAEFAEQSWEHLWRSQHTSVEKARRLLGYAPAHQPEDAVRAGVEWLVDAGDLGLPPLVG